MKSTTFSFLMLLIFLAACKPNANTQLELEKVRLELADKNLQLEAAQKELAQLKADQDAALVHLVLFKMKPKISEEDKASFLSELQKLDAIEQIRDFDVGTFKDLDDPRALSDYDVVLSMSFDNAEDYKKYQEDQRHIQVRDELGRFLGGPPATYDYWAEN